MQSVGEYDKALSVVGDALKDAAKDADLLARRAELLYLRGQWDEADKAVAAALSVKESHFLARWIQTELEYDASETRPRFFFHVAIPPRLWPGIMRSHFRIDHVL